MKAALCKDTGVGGGGKGRERKRKEENKLLFSRVKRSIFKTFLTSLSFCQNPLRYIFEHDAAEKKHSLNELC